eukprot:397839_1
MSVVGKKRKLPVPGRLPNKKRKKLNKQLQSNEESHSSSDEGLNAYKMKNRKRITTRSNKKPTINETTSNKPIAKKKRFKPPKIVIAKKDTKPQKSNPNKANKAKQSTKTKPSPRKAKTLTKKKKKKIQNESDDEDIEMKDEVSLDDKNQTKASKKAEDEPTVSERPMMVGNDSETEYAPTDGEDDILEQEEIIENETETAKRKKKKKKK